MCHSGERVKRDYMFIKKVIYFSIISHRNRFSTLMEALIQFEIIFKLYWGQLTLMTMLILGSIHNTLTTATNEEVMFSQ